jgi:hypothetical protein
MMPSMVSKLRSLCTLSARRAMRLAATHFMGSLAKTALCGTDRVGAEQSLYATVQRRHEISGQ